MQQPSSRNINSPKGQSSQDQQKLRSKLIQDVLDNQVAIKVEEYKATKERQARKQAIATQEKFNLMREYEKFGKAADLENEFIRRYGEDLMNKEKHAEFERKQEEERKLHHAQAVEHERKKIGKKVIVPTRDNLRFKTLAKYRALKDGDVLQYEQIEDIYVDNKPTVKGYALRSDSMEKFEVFKENRLYESENLSLENSEDVRQWDETKSMHEQRQEKKRKMKILVGEFKPPKKLRDSNDSNSDKDPFIHSSVDFWEDIEPKTNQNADMLDFSDTQTKQPKNGPRFSFLQSEFGNQSPGKRISLTKTSDMEKFLLPPNAKGKRKKRGRSNQEGFTGKVEATPQYLELKKKFDMLKAGQQVELRNVKNMAKQYTLDFFKSKSIQICHMFNSENQEIYLNYDSLRSKYFTREKKYGVISKFFNNQERIISELRAFIKDCLEKIFTVVEGNYGHIVQNIQAQLPGEKQYSRYDQENPFSLYCGYLDLVRPVAAEHQEMELNRQNEELMERLRQKEKEFNISHNVSQIYIEKEDGYKRRIAQLEKELAEIKKTSQIKVEQLEKKLEVMNNQGNEKYMKLVSEFNHYREFVNMEIKLNQTIAKKSIENKNQYINKIKELKAIIRIPRLYNQYRQALEQFAKLQEQQEYAINQYKHENKLKDTDMTDVRGSNDMPLSSRSIVLQTLSSHQGGLKGLSYDQHDLKEKKEIKDERRHTEVIGGRGDGNPLRISRSLEPKPRPSYHPKLVKLLDLQKKLPNTRGIPTMLEVEETEMDKLESNIAKTAQILRLLRHKKEAERSAFNNQAIRSVSNLRTSLDQFLSDDVPRPPTSKNFIIITTNEQTRPVSKKSSGFMQSKYPLSEQSKGLKKSEHRSEKKTRPDKFQNMDLQEVCQWSAKGNERSDFEISHQSAKQGGKHSEEGTNTSLMNHHLAANKASRNSRSRHQDSSLMHYKQAKSSEVLKAGGVTSSSQFIEKYGANIQKTVSQLSQHQLANNQKRRATTAHQANVRKYLRDHNATEVEHKTKQESYPKFTMTSSTQGIGLINSPGYTSKQTSQQLKRRSFQSSIHPALKQTMSRNRQMIASPVGHPLDLNLITQTIQQPPMEKLAKLYSPLSPTSQPLKIDFNSHRSEAEGNLHSPKMPKGGEVPFPKSTKNVGSRPTFKISRPEKGVKAFEPSRANSTTQGIVSGVSIQLQQNSLHSRKSTINETNFTHINLKFKDDKKKGRGPKPMTAQGPRTRVRTAGRQHPVSFNQAINLGQNQSQAVMMFSKNPRRSAFRPITKREKARILSKDYSTEELKNGSGSASNTGMSRGGAVMTEATGNLIMIQSSVEEAPIATIEKAKRRSQRFQKTEADLTITDNDGFADMIRRDSGMRYFNQYQGTSTTTNKKMKYRYEPSGLNLKTQAESLHDGPKPMVYRPHTTQYLESFRGEQQSNANTFAGVGQEEPGTHMNVTDMDRPAQHMDNLLDEKEEDYPLKQKYSVAEDEKKRRLQDGRQRKLAQEEVTLEGALKKGLRIE